MTNKYLGCLVGALLLIGAPFLFAEGQAEEEVPEGELPEMQAQIAHSPNPGGTAGAEAFAEYVDEATEGRFTVEPVAYHAIGSAREVTDQVRLGEMEFWSPATVGLSHVWPDIQMVNLPFLFPDRETFWQVAQEEDWLNYVRDNVLAASNGAIRYLGAAENSVRRLYSNVPIRVPADLEGVQIRVQESPIMQAVWDGLGATEVVAMPGSERDAAVQAGTLDAIEGSFGGAWASGNLSVLGHATLTGHVYDYMHYFTNNDYYESLPSQYQEVVDDGMEVAIEAHNEAALDSELESIEEAEEEGIWVYEPTEEEMQQWQELAIPAGREFLEGQVSEQFMELTFDTVERVSGSN